MIFKIVTPIKAYIIGATPEELVKIRQQTHYVSDSVVYNINKIKNNRWWKRSNPDTWQEALDNLAGQKDKYLLFKDVGGYFIRPGYISYLIGFTYTVENCVKYPTLKSLKWEKTPTFEPYDYQNDSNDLLLKIKHGCVSLPTGSGKSYLLELIAKNSGLDISVITPSASIFNQLLEEFTLLFGKARVGGFGDGKKDITKKISICINKSLANLKEGTKEYDFFAKKQMICVDESHTFAAETLEEVCHGVFSEVPYRLFFSATQTRGDGSEKLLYSIIGPCVYEMSIEEAIKKGYLCPLKFTVLKTTSPSPLVIRDAMDNKREHFLRNKNIAELVAKIANAKWRSLQESTLILVEELSQISMVMKLLEVPYGYVHAASKKEAAEVGLIAVKSAEQIEKFNKGEIKVLIGTKAIATGTNMFPTHNTINFSGGNSEIVTKQGTMGRSTRKLENSKYKEYHKPKPYSMIYDFDVRGNKLLETQLRNRIKFYEESGELVKIV
jgi:superfamily II DNA or RNA helicase